MCGEGGARVRERKMDEMERMRGGEKCDLNKTGKCNSME